MFFGIHVMMACLHNWIAYRFFPDHGDIWFFFKESIALKEQLSTHPAKALSVFLPFLHEFSLTSTHSFWTFLQYQLLIYINTFLNFLSFNNFYINSLLFSFFSFWGNIALFRFFKAVFHNDLLCAALALFIPSTLFWTSCIHKEAVLYLMISFLCYYLYRLMHKPATTKGIVWCLFFLLLAFLCRTNLLFILLPAFCLWFIAEKIPIKKSLLFVLILIIPGLFSLLPGMLDEHFNIFSVIAERQSEFQELAGNSRIYLPVLEPTVHSFFAVLPIAFFNGFFNHL